MARKIIIQERLNEPSDFDFRVVYWVDVPPGRESLYADEKKFSSVKDATAEEINSIKLGTIAEYTNIVSLNAGASLDDVKAYAMKYFAIFQDEVNSRNPGKLYGTYFDGRDWVDGGIQ